MPEDEREGVWDIKRGGRRSETSGTEECKEPEERRNRGMDREGWGEGEGVNKRTCGEEKKKGNQHFLPVRCLRGKEIGGGMGVQTACKKV